MHRALLLILLSTLTAVTGAQSEADHTMAAPAGPPPPPARSWPAEDGVQVLRDFRFGSGETLPELRLHYLTLGKLHRDAHGRADNAVLLLHGTGGNAHTLLNPIFADELFGAGQPLDIDRYFLILPDDIGHGGSSKPSDGLHMRFPHYDYADMVRSQRLMLMGMHVEHLRLILGTSMGCMQSFVWGETYPGFADALAPLACLPTAIAGRNRMMRYMAMQAIRQDPAWRQGEYAQPPLLGLRTASEFLMIMGSSALRMQKEAPTREAADAFVEHYLQRVVPGTDANDFLYYLDASRNYDPAPGLGRIQVPVLYINSADDFINPPELGIAERMAARMPHCRFVLIPISEATRGHGTHTAAALWKDELARLMGESQR